MAEDLLNEARPGDVVLDVDVRVADALRNAGVSAEDINQYIQKRVAQGIPPLLGQVRARAKDELEAAVRDQVAEVEQRTAGSVGDLAKVVGQLTAQVAQLQQGRPAGGQDMGIMQVMVALIQSQGQQQQAAMQQQMAMQAEVLKLFAARQEAQKPTNDFDAMAKLLILADGLASRGGAGGEGASTWIKDLKDLSQTGIIEDGVMAYLALKGHLSQDEIKQIKDDKAKAAEASKTEGGNDGNP